jgi:23S rRNA (pseudouridine1915-N3)-methyltransferase
VHIRLLAVGDRQPSWVDEAFGIYTDRFPREWKYRTDVIPTAARSKSDKSRKALEALLDERGRQLSSKGLAGKLANWQSDGRDLCFVIGGPDGVSDACRQRADFTWSLSQLTLPHGLARVLFAEQLYRAHSLHTGHPYHRA